MSRAISPAMQRAINAQESDKIFLTLVELNHVAWAMPKLLVDNRETVTHGGSPYSPFPFSITIPNQEERGHSIMRFVADAVSGDIVRDIRVTTAQGGRISAVVTWVLFDTPDVIEAGPIVAELFGVTYDGNVLSGSLSLEPVLDDPFGYMQMTPNNAPGLF